MPWKECSVMQELVRLETFNDQALDSAKYLIIGYKGRVETYRRCSDDRVRQLQTIIQPNLDRQ